MNSKVISFQKLSKMEGLNAGGKGGTLAQLYQDGYPVPDGFVILPSAFMGDELTKDGWEQVQTALTHARNGAQETSFAVRSSALSEDSAQASFAGEFETVLDVRSDEMIREAIHTVRRSRLSRRVQAYSLAKGMDLEQEIAVVVQQLVRADISGILFTADPVTGSQMSMSGNYIYGLGDALVSGEVEPFTFTLSRPKGVYEGPAELKPIAKKLYKMGKRLEKELGCAQDIEWCVADGKLYLLQSRPITTLIGYDADSGVWNSSYSGDYLWFRHEVFPDVLTPSSWSVWQSFQQFNIAGMEAIGNIGGRLYMNVSLMAGMMKAVGRTEESFVDQFTLLAGVIPEGIIIPEVPITRTGFIKSLLPVMFELFPRQLRLSRQWREIVGANPQKCAELQFEITETEDKSRLIALWHDAIFPLYCDFLQLQDKKNEDYSNPYIALKKNLTKLVGEEKANHVLSTLSGGTGQLSSMESLVGLAKLSKGEMSRQEYMQLTGHRPVKENELAEPRSYEDPDWLNKQLADFEGSPFDIEAMVAKRAAEFDTLWWALEQDYPRQAKKLSKKVTKITEAMEQREQVRSELTRVLGVIRAWFLQAGDLTRLDEDIFYLTYQEVIELLSGKESAAYGIVARQEAYQELEALPAYPMFICGRFDPYQWAADPNRRSDVYDSHTPYKGVDSDTIKGYPGSSGRIEGIVRLLDHPEEGYMLQEGEILLASTTNVGWTPLFPRAVAVITDIGAPLSHAAIIARELGIPAVVGCGDATMRLRTGDRVRVDGGRGIVEILVVEQEPVLEMADVRSGI